MQKTERIELIREILSNELGNDFVKPIASIDANEDLFTIGMDSLNLIKLIVALESEFDFIFDDEDILENNLKTLSKLDNLIYLRTVDNNASI